MAREDRKEVREKSSPLEVESSLSRGERKALLIKHLLHVKYFFVDLMTYGVGVKSSLLSASDTLFSPRR